MPNAQNFDFSELTRTTRFIQFLRAAVAVKTKPITEVNKYRPVVWFSKLPTGLDEIRSPLLTSNWPADDARWLIVARVPVPDRPLPPDSCQPWLLDVNLDGTDAVPVLNLLADRLDETGAVVQVPPTLEALAAWEVYLSRHWTVWAKKAAVARAVRPIYQTLFSAHQELQGRSDAYDCFVGAGLLDSRIDAAQHLHRHLVAFAAELTLDDRTGTISVGPAPEFTAIRLETDFLPSADRARLETQADALRDAFIELGSAINDRTGLADLLTRLVTPLNAVSHYFDDLSPVDAPPSGTRVSFAPALVVRPRSTRSLDHLLKRIEADTAGPNPAVPLERMPICWRKMMEEQQAWDGPANGPTVPTIASSESVYFPLPSNEEQSKIVRLAGSAPGVVVQGPPGTGKSHTIANLISHYLATGQRVLVTAQTAQSLEVLRDKLPPDLQQLCVSLLGDTRSSDKELRRSVEGILAQHRDFDVGESARRIAKLEAQLTESETRLNSLERTLHQARAAETEVLEPVRGYRGTRAQLARRLSAERNRYSWIGDEIPHDTACPVFPDGWDELGKYHATLDATLRARLSRRYVDPPFTRAQAVQAVVEIAAAQSAIPADIEIAGLASLPPTLSEGLVSAKQWLARLTRIESDIGEDDRAWVKVLRKCLMRSLSHWVTLRDEATRTLGPVTENLLERIVTVEVTGHPVPEARRDLIRLSAHYSGGGHRRRLGLLKPRVVKECEWVEQGVTVEGVPVRTVEDVLRARDALDGLAGLDSAWGVWSQWPFARVAPPRLQAAFLRHRLALLNSLLGLSDDRPRGPQDLRDWLDAGLLSGQATAALTRAVERRLAELALAAARARRDALLRDLIAAIGHNGNDAVPALAQLFDGLKSEDANRVSAAFDALSEEVVIRQRYTAYQGFINAVRKAAPKMAEAIVADEGRETWGTAFAQFEEAWEHRCAQSWLNVILSSKNIEATHRAARDERQRCQDTLAQLTSAKAWARGLERIDDRRRASLVSWAQAVAKIPATGLSVFRKRAEAQRLLGGCLDVIPAWVVSLGRLYETIHPVPGLFDVAIIDEASQCWLDSLVLFYLAKKVIVVGDDKQISPTIVGIADGEIDVLTRTFLADFDFGSRFTLGSSLFDHANRYLSAGVPLREHFRCVPEIIRFSNELCYTVTPLIPLRQVGKGRLEPLKRTYLPNGLRHGDVNDVEAEAVVDAIATCHQDPEYRRS